MRRCKRICKGDRISGRAIAKSLRGTGSLRFWPVAAPDDDVAVSHKPRYNLEMTRALEKAFAEASQLASSEQDRIARWLLAEISDERAWDLKFADSQDLLAQLADEALADVAKGHVTNLDSSKL